MALTFADLAEDRLLRPGGSPGDELGQRLRYAVERRSEIHQAQGMLMVDFDVIRRNLALIDVAQEILAGGRLPSPDGPQA